MKKAGTRVIEAAMVMLSLLLGGCGTVGSLGGTPPTAPYTKGVLPLVGKDGMGHLCPVTPKRAWTAAHVPENKDGEMRPMVVEIGGNPATLMAYDWDERRDLAWVMILDEGVEFEYYYDVSEKVPAEGDEVWIVGFEAKTGMKPRVTKAKVLNVEAGRIYYDDTPGPGSSGSCVLNGEGEVVGVNTSYFVIVENGETELVGAGFIVVGEWGTITSWEPAAEAE